MARFSALTLLITVFYFLVWATQVSTPSHSNTSLRTIKIVPQLLPTLTISASPSPIHSTCASIVRCDRSPIYGVWASRVVKSINQARNYLNVRSIVHPHRLQVGRYVHQLMDMLGRPTPESSVGLMALPTTGRLSALPLEWVRVDKTPVALPPPPPPHPTRTFSMYFAPSPTSGPWNPPSPATGHSRPRNTEPIVKAKPDCWLQRMVPIGSTLILIVTSFVLRFKAALSSIKCVEHRNPGNDGVVLRCNSIRSVVPPLTQSSARRLAQKSCANLSIQPTIVTQPSRPNVASPPAVCSEPVVDDSLGQILDLVIWRAPVFVPNRIILPTPSPLTRIRNLELPRQLGVALRQSPRRNNILNHSDRKPLIVREARRVPLLLGWHATTARESVVIMPPPVINEVFTNIPIIPYYDIPAIFNSITGHLVRARPNEPRPPKPHPITERHAPLLIEWYPAQSGSIAEPLEVIRRSLPPDPTYTPSLTLVPYAPTSVRPIRVVSRLVPRSPFDNTFRPVTLQQPLAGGKNLARPGIVTGRGQPLLIQWKAALEANVALPSASARAEAKPLLLTAPLLPLGRLITTLTTQRPHHAIAPRSLNALSHILTAPITNPDRTRPCPPTRPSIELHVPLQVIEPSENEFKASLFSAYTGPSIVTSGVAVVISESLASTSASFVQPKSPPQPTAPLRIPPSFYRYGNIRLEDLDQYPPEERHQVLRREIQAAENHYRQEKPRRDRTQFKIRWMRSEMERRGKRYPKRQKREEEVEEEEDMKRVMRARMRGEEEVFQGRGGPPPPPPQWLAAWFEAIKRDSAPSVGNGGGKCAERKGILKRSVKNKSRSKKKGKYVRWADEVGRRLAS